jgi:predicted esterase
MQSASGSNPPGNSPYADFVTTRWIAILLGLLVVLVPGTSAQAQRQRPLFELDGDRVIRAIVTTGVDLPELPEPPPGRELPEMVLEASGVLEIIDGRRVSELRALAPRNAKPIGRPPDARSVCFIHLIGSSTTKTIEVVTTNDGLVVGEQVGTGLDRPPRAALNRIRWVRLSDSWSRYRGGFDAGEDQLATSFVMPTPYVQGAFTMDFKTVEERFFAGKRLRQMSSLDRVLNEDPINVRLPRGYDPSQPAGLLVWISPTPNGTIPSQFSPSLDELGLIAVGADNSGNGRNVNSRYQLVFDGIATASERYHVDPERIYVTGMSGGGRVSSMIGACFPDVFAGTIPIVGMNSYDITARGDGKRWARGFYRPPSKLFHLLRTRRTAPISGSRDFNYAEMQAASRVLKRDRVPIRFFDYEDMAHEMPRPQRFMEAMQWVDEPYREEQSERIAKAQQLLDEYNERFGPGVVARDGEIPANDAASPEAAGLLLDVIETAPWSPAAWSALELFRG